MSNTTFSKLKEDFLRIPAARALVRTDGRGRILQVYPARDDGDALSQGLDLALGVVAELGRKNGFGELQMALFSFDSGHVVLGALPGDEVIAIVAGQDTNIGLLLSQVRRALAGDQAS